MKGPFGSVPAKQLEKQDLDPYKKGLAGLAPKWFRSQMRNLALSLYGTRNSGVPKLGYYSRAYSQLKLTPPHTHTSWMFKCSVEIMSGAIQVFWSLPWE